MTEEEKLIFESILNKLSKKFTFSPLLMRDLLTEGKIVVKYEYDGKELISIERVG